MKKYPEYKDSGVEWIGKIPIQWEVIKLRFLCNITTGNKDTANSVLDGEYPFYVRSPNIERIDSFSFDGEAILTAGDGVGAGKVFHYVNGKFDYHQRVYNLHHFRSVYGKFLYYYMLENFHKEIEQGNAKSTVDSIRLPMLQNFPIAVPDIQSQIDTVTHLDRKTAQIDSIIADKEKLIALLKEKRQAVISEAVTRGLDSTAPMKDSGVEWIGQIPAHWDKKQIKFVFEIVKRIYGKEDRDVLSITQHGIKIRDIESNDGQLAQDYSKYQVVNIHDFAMNSMDLLTGYVDCSAYEGVTSPDYRVFRFMPEKVMCHTYYTYLFQMCYTNKIFYGFGQGVSNLGRWRLQTDTFLNFWIPIPPLNEQEEIARYITVQAKRIDELIALAERQIVLLKEYRQSIISEAVTGKIMVTAPQSVEQTEQPAAKSGGANVHFKRRVLAAKILDKLCGEPTLGHVKLEKLLFLSEYCAELDMHTEYVRHAAGPYSPKTLRSIDTQLQKAKWFLYDKNNRGSKYSRLDKSTEYLPYFDANFSAAQNATVERLVELFRPLDTERCEIVATLYGAWNDFLIDGCSPTDEQIADEVLTHWSEEKKRIDKDRWLKAIGWMRKHQIVPCGYGEKTKRRDS